MYLYKGSKSRRLPGHLELKHYNWRNGSEAWSEASWIWIITLYMRLCYSTTLFGV